MLFRLHTLRFDFVAIDAVRFPVGRPGNILRGALGTIFQKLACAPDCPGVKRCRIRDECAYARVFEPSSLGPGPSGLADWPRPFVFRAGHLDGSTANPGDSFHFDLNLFEMREDVFPYFTRAFGQLGREGLGPGRGRARLRSIHELDGAGDRAGCVYRAEDGEPGQLGSPLQFEMDPGSDEIHGLRVRFAMPTELKADRGVATRPDFAVLFARARDRVSTLRALYQGGPLQLDFSGLGSRAGAVRTLRCDVEWRDATRRSTKTGQEHPIGGFVGEVEYRGDLTEFYPFLHVAQWTGVGRHTVWGNGAIELTVLGGS